MKGLQLYASRALVWKMITGRVTGYAVVPISMLAAAACSDLPFTASDRSAERSYSITAIEQVLALRPAIDDAKERVVPNLGRSRVSREVAAALEGITTAVGHHDQGELHIAVNRFADALATLSTVVDSEVETVEVDAISLVLAALLRAGQLETHW